MPIATIATVAKQLKAKGKPRYARCLETLVRAGDVLDMFPIVPCNQGTTHKILRRKKLGSGGTLRAINQGVKASQPETEEATEVTARLEDRCPIDEDLLTLNDGASDYIENQNEGVRLALRNRLNDLIVYGNRAAPGSAAGIDGLATRYNSFGRIINENTKFDHVQNFGGTGNNLTSIYLLAPGPQSVYLINPDDGTPAGLSIKEYNSNNGVFIDDENGDPYRGHLTWYKWKIGLAVENDHAIMRLANIPATDIETMIRDGAADPKNSILLRKLIHMKNMFSADVDIQKLMMIVSRSTFSQMDIILFDKVNAYWKPTEVRESFHDRSVGMFSGIPVFASDSILETESAVA